MKMTVHLQTVSCASTAEQEKGAAVFLNITHTSPLTVGPDGGRGCYVSQGAGANCCLSGDTVSGAT